MISCIVVNTRLYYEVSTEKRNIGDCMLLVTSGVQFCQVSNNIVKDVIVDVSEVEVVVHCMGNCNKYGNESLGDIECEDKVPFKLVMVDDKPYMTWDLK